MIGLIEGGAKHEELAVGVAAVVVVDDVFVFW